MMDSEALLRLLSMLTQGGRGQATAGPITPPTQFPPDYAARQLMGAGALGGPLAQRQAQLADPTAIAAALQQAQGAAPAAAAPAQRPTFYRPDDPSTMDPTQLMAYMQAHGIQKPKSQLDQLIDYLASAASAATASAKGKQ